MPEPMVLTHSDLSSYLMCRRKFYLGYVLDWSMPESRVGYLALGSRVHKSIEPMYGTGADPIAEHDRLGRADLAHLESEDTPPWVTQQLYEDIIIGRNCVRLFKEWLEETGADHGFDVVAVERRLEAPILGGRVHLRGKADIIRRRALDGALIVEDLKTSSRYRAGLRENLERSYQHSTYLALVSLVEAEPVAAAWYTTLFKAKNPARMTNPPVERFQVASGARLVSRKLAQIERICEEVLTLIAAVETDVNAAFPSPQDACRWCEFRHPCELMDDSPAAAVEMLETNYHKGRKHARYDPDVVD